MYSMEHPFFFRRSIDVRHQFRHCLRQWIDHPWNKGDASFHLQQEKTLFTREIEDPIVRLCVDGVAEIGSNGLPTGPMPLVFLRSEQRLH